MVPDPSVTPVATGMTSTASTSPEPRTSSSSAPSSEAVAPAPASTGLLVPADPRTRPASLARSSVENSGTSRPAPAAASAASTPMPPAFDTIASRRPCGNGCSASSSAVRARSSASWHAITPACANRASTPTAGVAAAAVWEAPARLPPAERPPTTASSGLRSAKRRANRANLAALPKDSR